ncbi:MAG TPA: hypothetical protein ENN03_03805, partial [bacterium]|nr:hypothetical protein [bacterium]
MKNPFFTPIILIALKLGTGHAAGQEIVLSDPLNGSTAGTQRGSGTFVTGGGWKSEGGQIIFDAGRLIENGFFEAKMRGWTAPTGSGEKSHPLSGWEEKDKYDRTAQNGSYWNWRIGSRYGTPQREYPYKVLAKPDTSDERVEIGLGHKEDVNDGNPHTYRVAWENGTISFYFDGQLMHSWSFHRFKQRYFVIGRDDNYGITDPAPIISDVLIGDYGENPAEDRWVQIAPSVSPGNRQYHDMAFIGDNQVLLFGGRTATANNETWLFYGSQKTWSRLAPQGSIPSSRSGHTMAHVGGNQVLLFGGITGYLNGETWIFEKSENTWTRKFPASSPSPRRYPAMAYIGGKKALLFGGNDGQHNNETWVYDAGVHTWTRMTPSVSPSAREGHCMAYIGQDRVLLFGGNANGIFSDETWIYDLSDNEWTLLTPVSYIPSKRGYLDAAYLGNSRVLIAGGYHTHYYSKAHIFDLNELRWESVSSADAPSARVGHKIAETQIDGSGSLVLFGGENSGTYYGDTWLYPQCGSAPNLPPQITSAKSVTAYADSLFEYTARAVDPEGDPVIFTFIEYPSWMSPSDSVISGTPGIQDQDTLFQFIASDGQSADTATVSVTVVHVNQPPRITSATHVTAYADS